MRKKDFYNNDFEEKDFNPYSLTDVIADPEQEKFNALVFAPDPETGNPTSDVYYLLYGTDEGFKAFIKEKLFKSSGSALLAENADVAIDMVKPNLMTSEQYLSYAREYVGNMVEPVQTIESVQTSKED